MTIIQLIIYYQIELLLFFGGVFYMKSINLVIGLGPVCIM